MPGEVITIDPINYPALNDLDDGEVTLKIKGTKAVDDDGQIKVTTTSIEPMDVNPAKKAIKDMKGLGNNMSGPSENYSPDGESDDE